MSMKGDSYKWLAITSCVEECVVVENSFPKVDLSPNLPAVHQNRML